MWFNAIRALSVLACLTPGLWLAFEWSAGELGIDPLARLLRFSGLSAISLLLVTLSVTPLRRCPWPWRGPSRPASAAACRTGTS